jgi:DUF4097 and DUF4098 domain-containing protein YvlB
MRTTTKWTAASTVFTGLALAALPAVTFAQSKVDEKRAASPEGTVEIENAAGSVRVIGWGRPEITITGTLGAGAEGLDFSGGPKHTKIEVDVEGNPHQVSSDLEIHLPAASKIEINSFSANITVTDVTGAVSAETVSGSISVSGPAREVSAHTVQGVVEITGAVKSVEVEGVNGPVTVKGATGTVNANTVDGRLSVTGTSLERAELEAVSGSVVFDGSLAKDADLSVQTVSGNVDLVLPASLSADVSISTFSGAVQSEFGDQASKGRRGRRSDEFTIGAGDAQISVETLSGTIALRKKP